MFETTFQVCRNIRESREKKGKEWSQQRLADRMSELLGKEITRSTYRNWEETTEPPLAIIRTIAFILGMQAWELLIGEIEFSNQKVTPIQDPDPVLVVKLKKSQIRTLEASLNAIGSAFRSASQTKKDSRPGRRVVLNVGNKKSPGSTLKGKKDKQKDISLQKDK